MRGITSAHLTGLPCLITNLTSNFWRQSCLKFWRARAAGYQAISKSSKGVLEENLGRLRLQRVLPPSTSLPRWMQHGSPKQWRHNTEGRDLDLHRRENLKYHINRFRFGSVPCLQNIDSGGQHVENRIPDQRFILTALKHKHYNWMWCSMDLSECSCIWINDSNTWKGQ
jgi:hypothetical protein